MERSESIAALAKALSEFQAEVGDPEKTQTAKIQPKDQSKQAFSFPYADLLSILQDARPLAAKHGLAIVQDVTCGERQVNVSTILLHESGEYMTLGPLSLPAEGDSKAWGGVITSARRFALMPALGVATQGDDGGSAGRSSGSGGASRLATSGQIAKIKGEAGRGKIGTQALIADVVKTYQLGKAVGANLDDVLSVLTVSQASNLIERLMAEIDRRQQATAAGADPETGEVREDSEHTEDPDSPGHDLPNDQDDAIGFDEGPPGMDAEEFRESRQPAPGAPPEGRLA